MNLWFWFFIGLYFGTGWLFARSFQKHSDLDPHRINAAVALLALMLLWPLGVLSMLIVMSMIVLFPRIKK